VNGTAARVVIAKVNSREKAQKTQRRRLVTLGLEALVSVGGDRAPWQLSSWRQLRYGDELVLGSQARKRNRRGGVGKEKALAQKY